MTKYWVLHCVQWRRSIDLRKSEAHDVASVSELMRKLVNRAFYYWLPLWLWLLHRNEHEWQEAKARVRQRMYCWRKREKMCALNTSAEINSKINMTFDSCIFLSLIEISRPLPWEPYKNELEARKILAQISSIISIHSAHNLPPERSCEGHNDQLFSSCGKHFAPDNAEEWMERPLEVLFCFFPL